MAGSASLMKRLVTLSCAGCVACDSCRAVVVPQTILASKVAASYSQFRVAMICALIGALILTCLVGLCCGCFASRCGGGAKAESRARPMNNHRWTRDVATQSMVTYKKRGWDGAHISQPRFTPLAEYFHGVWPQD